jgi:hypothetical protein
MQKELQVKKDYAAVGEQISHEMAADFITAYGEAYPGDVRYFGMGKTILEQILAQPGCVGMRFYNGINEKGQKTLVYVGIDESGNDIVKRVMVQDDGAVIVSEGVVSDRNDNGFSWLGWLFGM